MTDRKTKFVPLWMLAGLALGALCGYYLPQVSLALDFLGKLFLGGLKLLIIPLIVAGIISGINAFGDMRKAGRFGGRALVYFLATTGVAVLIALIVVLVVVPGRGILPVGPVGSATGWGSVSEVLGGLIPGNLVQAVSEGKYLGVVLLALFLGGVLTAMGVRGRTAVTLFKSIHEGLLKLVTLLLLVAPVGLFSLIGSAVANSSLTDAEVSSAGAYALTVVVVLVIHGFLILPLILWLFCRRSPLEFYRNLTPAFLTAFGTSTSVAAFPVTYDCLTDRCKVDSRATSMVLPLGTVINLDGTAICMVVATLFAAQVSGVSIGLLQVVGVAVLAVLLSIGAAGIPSATLLAAPVLFGAVGLAAGQVAMATGAILAFDWLVDRVRAVVNLGSDAVGAGVLAESFELKTARRTPGRERRPARTARGRTGPTREQRSPRTESRSGVRRQERPSSATRTRGRRTDTPSSSDTPAKPRGTRSQPTRPDRSPFKMTASNKPPLGIESVPVPSERPSERPTADATGAPESRRSDVARRRPTRSGSGSTGERKTRTRSRTPAIDRRGSERSAAPELKPESESNNVDNGRLSPTVVARELARVSAQLKVPEKTDANDVRPVTDESQTRLELAPTETPPSSAGRSAEPIQPEIPEKPSRGGPEDSAEAKEPQEPQGSTPTAEVSLGESLEGEQEEQAAPPEVFGRSRRQRGAAFKKKGTPAPRVEPPVSDEADDSAQADSGETVTFGRVKRKRIRR